MKVTIENTNILASLNGIPARVWEGETDSGIKVICYVTRIAVRQDEPRIAEFDRELDQQRDPSAEVLQFPLRLII